MNELAQNIAITISELKGHALMGGTMMKNYADDIVSDTLTDLKELKRLAKIGEAFEYFMTSPDVEEYVVVSIGKREYDTIEDVISQYEYYKEWQK